MLYWFSQIFQRDDLRKNDLKENLFKIEQYNNLHTYIIDHLYKTVFTNKSVLLFIQNRFRKKEIQA